MLRRTEQWVARRHEGNAEDRVEVGPHRVVEHPFVGEVAPESQVQIPGVKRPTPGTGRIAVDVVVLREVVVVVEDQLNGQVVDHGRHVYVVEDVGRDLGAAQAVDVSDERPQIGVVLVQSAHLLVERLQVLGRTARAEVAERLVARSLRIEAVARYPVVVRGLHHVEQAEELPVLLDPHRHDLVKRRAGVTNAFPGENLADVALVGIVALQVEVVDTACEQVRRLEAVTLRHEKLPGRFGPTARRLPADAHLNGVVEPAGVEQDGRLRQVGVPMAEGRVVVRRVHEPVQDL